MIVRCFVTCLCLFSMALPATSQAYRSVIWLYVVPITEDTFEVIEDGSIGPSEFWCAGADYARAAGLDGVRKRMYVETPRGPSKTRPGRMGVVFTTNPGDDIKDTPSSYSVTVKRRGENLSIAHARNFCHYIIEDEFNLF